MKNLVAKTAVKTALIILGVLVVAFVAFNFACPQHMATFAENTGSYSLALRYASLRYYYTGDVYDLARCADDAILTGNPDYIVDYGGQFLSHEDKDEVIADRNQSLSGIEYGNFVESKVVVAHYELGNLSKALELAYGYNGTTSFEYGNALMSLSVAVAENNDAASVPKVKEILQLITSAEPQEQQYLLKVLEMLGATE